MKKLIAIIAGLLLYAHGFAQTYQNHFIAVVTDYGAVGDGTTDNLTAFNNATAAVAAAGGGTVWIPQGNFKVSSNVSTQHTRTMFTGDKGAIVHFTSNSHVGFYLQHDSCSVVGLNIWGAYSSASSITNGTPVYIFGSSYCRAYDNTISGAGGNGIEIYVDTTSARRNANYNQIKGNYIIHPKGTAQDNSGILLGYAAFKPAKMVGNEITGNVIQGDHVINKGILMLGPGYENVFDKNEINNVNNYGITLYSYTGPDTTLRDNHITNNRVYSVGLVPTSDTTKGSGIYVQSAFRTIITDNTVRQAGINNKNYSSLPVGGISVNCAAGSVISNNVIDSCTNVPGINVANVFTGISINNNHVYNSKLGVQITNSNGVTIANNQLLFTSSSGIFVTAALAGCASRPPIYCNKHTGINYSIRGNSIQATGAGIQMTGSLDSGSTTVYDTITYAKIINNNIRSSYTNGGIYLTYFSNGQVTGNTVVTSGSIYGINITGTTQSINNDVNFNQLISSTAYTNGINTAGTAHSVIDNYINSATTQLSIAGTTYNANENLINGLVLETSDAVNTATNANYTITSSNQLVKLPVITAARTVSIPSASAFKGRRIHIWNQNTAAFNWSFTGATVKDSANTTLTNLTNTSLYVLESDGTNWVKVN